MNSITLKNGAVDINKNIIDRNHDWKIKECYTLFAVITNGYTNYVVETKYIKKLPRSK